MNNYRPISLLPIFSKIFEKLILKQIVGYLDEHKILTDSQFGFRKNFSTAHAVLALVDNIIKSFEEKNFYQTLFLDLSKAFDTISHSILLKKLDKYNFSSDSINLIKSYLSNRLQKVNINGEISKECKVEHGVPQGSILGPLLFLIYINDLPYSVPRSDTILYADDTTLGMTDTNQQNVDVSMSEQYNNVQNWLIDNRLHLNTSKTIKLTFSLKNMEYNTNESDFVKFLGVYVDTSLTWNVHAEKLSDKICKNIYLLRNLANCLTPQTLKIAYYALVQSHLEYCLILWGHCSSFPRLFRLQRRAIRAVSGLSYREDCKEQFKKLNILTFPSLYILKCLEYILKNINQYKTLGAYHNYNTRGNDICLQNLRLTKSRHGVNYYSIKFYNVLPNELKNSSPISSLKKIKKYLLLKAFYSIEEYLESDFYTIE